MRHQGATRRAALIAGASALALVTTRVSAESKRKLRFSSAFTEQDLRAEAYKKFAAAGKKKPQIVTAVGRELLGFIWAIAVETEAQFRVQSNVA